MKRFLFTAIALITLLGGVPAHAAGSGDTATYTYDAAGRLVMVTYANGTTVTYIYDGAGNRTSVVIACHGTGGTC